MIPYMCTIISAVTLYGCETWSFTLREELMLRMLGNRVLRRIFEPEIEKVMGCWEAMHNVSFIICFLHWAL
jgi:hypothetical protein